jgi:acyl-coenzyme A thioesterase PaaI-like protein
MTATTPQAFSEVSAVVAVEPGEFEASVDPNWTIGGKPNGGYLLAMLGRAATAISPHPHVITASAFYLRAPSPGPVAVDAEVLREGRSASQVRARMIQDDQDCVDALFITSQLDPAGSPYWDRGLPEPGQVGYEDCARLIPRLPGGNRVAIMDQVEVRLDPESSAFTRGEPNGRGELRGWLALPGEEDFDPCSLLFAVDAFPPATFDIEFSGWVPTLELTVYVRALPAPGPVRVLQRAELVDGQRVDESCHVWDRNGRLVAQGRQLAGVRLGT